MINWPLAVVMDTVPCMDGLVCLLLTPSSVWHQEVVVTVIVVWRSLLMVGVTKDSLVLCKSFAVTVCVSPRQVLFVVLLFIF